MTLCLVGNQKLDELQELALSNFSQIQNKGYVEKDYTNEVTFCSENGLGHVYFVVP